MQPTRLGRYLVFEAFARGGMANVHYGRATGPVGFSRIVAIKRHHSHLAKESGFVSMLIDEARIAGRIRHPNVVPVLDVVQLPGELLLVMDYVSGLSLAQALKLSLERGELPPLRISAALVAGALEGLNAAHETRDDSGAPAGIVHRDVSPQNVLLGADGVVRVTDFGIAHARERLQFTRTEEIKGKLEYMAKEQLRRERVDGRTDVYAASVVLWELLTGARMFANDTEQTLVRRVASGEFPAPSSLVADVPPELDQLVLRGLEPEPSARFASALEMATALDHAVGLASQREVAEWFAGIAADAIEKRARRVREIEAWTEPVQRNPSEDTIVDEVHDEAPPVEARASEPVVVPTRPMGEATAVETRFGDTAPRTLTSAVAVEAPESITLTLTDDVPTEPLEIARQTSPPTERLTRPTRVAAAVPWIWLLPAAAAALGALLIVWVLVRRTPASIEGAAAPRAVGPRGMQPAPSLLPPAVLPAAPASANGVVVPPPERPTASASEPPAPSTRPPAPGPGPRAPWVPKAAPPSCNPPYRIDAQGVRVPKPECFK